jgi:hypothetical protein
LLNKLGKVGFIMNIEFHYYITKYLALSAGFDEDEAEIIAYSSQFVDDNYLRLTLQTEDEKTYINYISQTRDITNPPAKLMRIYLLFHYFPGDPISPKVRRRDGKMHLLMTTPGNTFAQDVFYSANLNDNLYSLGIASHMLADTFAHQNFVGLYDELNSINGIWQPMVPKIGHSDAEHKPDIPNLIWFDPRLIQENARVDNSERIILAAKKLYNNYLFITSMPNKWNSVKKNLEKALSVTINETELKEVPEQQEKRIKQYKKWIENLDAEADYNPNSWLNAALKTKVDYYSSRKDEKEFEETPLHTKTNFERTHWFKFQEAIKEYQKIATHKLEPLLSQIELKEW